VQSRSIHDKAKKENRGGGKTVTKATVAIALFAGTFASATER
jgi:hypothetical protein